MLILGPPPLCPYIGCPSSLPVTLHTLDSLVRNVRLGTDGNERVRKGVGTRDAYEKRPGSGVGTREGKEGRIQSKEYQDRRESERDEE